MRTRKQLIVSNMAKTFYQCFIYAILLLVLLDVEMTIADDPEENENLYITCGSAIKIQQRETEYYLNSEEKQLGNGSGQQIVTFTNDAATHNTLWNIRPANHMEEGQEYPWDIATCQLAEPVLCNSWIRLTHVSTNRNLHSHDVESVLSRQQEISAYGTGDRKGDAGDNWMVHCTKAGQKYWQRNIPMRLQHVDTSKFLGTAKNVEFNTETCGHSCPLMGHLEAFGRVGTDSHTILTTEQGIYLSK
jgi:dolichyl-phosphate-mannose--protein O-mannosyl transferase